MGIRKKRKEVKGMKRSISIAAATVLIMSTMFSAAYSYAEPDNSQSYDNQPQKKITENQNNNKLDQQNKNNKNQQNKNNNGQQEKSNKQAVQPSNIDTSWFDYKHPKKKYNITSEAQLLGLASLVNHEQPIWKPTRLETFEGTTFTLTKDIKLTQSWTPIGSSEAICFKGVFDGNGHTISNLKIDTSSSCVGFFGYLKGEVRDLNIKGKIKTNSTSCGSIAGSLDATGKVKNCISFTDIVAGSRTGGIVGENRGTIVGCVNLGNIKGTYRIGGVVGENWGGVIEESGNQGKISSSVRGVATYGTGGVAGRSVASTALISDCYNTGDIYSGTEATGGVAGYTNAPDCKVVNSYNTGDIKIKKIKKKEGTASSWAGGVIGVIGTEGVKVSNCYSSGEIKGADTSGGFAGHLIADKKADISKNIKNNYYLNEKCDTGIGKDHHGKKINELSGSISAVSGGTLSSMTSALGISFMKDSSGLYGNNGYPVLRWQKPISADDKDYLEGVSKEVQMKLDKYLINNTEDTNKGDTVLSIFNPDNYLTDALLMYDEAMDKEKRDNRNIKTESEKEE